MKKAAAFEGKYYKKLSRVFILIAFTFSLFFAALFMSGYAQVRQKEEDAQAVFAQNRYNLVDTGIAVILNELNAFVRNPVLAAWADAPDSVAYYHTAANLYSHIKFAASQLGAISYEFAVVGERFNDMTISGLGSGPSGWYFKTETRLSPQQIETLVNYQGSADSLLVMPVYDTAALGGVLRELYFIRRLVWKTQQTFVILKALANPVFLPTAGENFYISGPHGIAIYSRDAGTVPQIFEQRLADGKEVFVDKKNRYFMRSLNSFPWQIVSSYPRNSAVQVIIAFAFGALTLLLCLLFRYAAKKITVMLYYPLNEVVRPSLDEKDVAGGFDEFEILRDNSRKIALLSRELQETIEEKESLAAQKYYRNLIEGILPAEEAPDSSTYFASCVLLADAGQKERELLLWVRFSVDAYARANKRMHYVQYGADGFVLLLQCETRDGAKKMLKTLFSRLEEEQGEYIEMCASLSDAVTGKTAIRDAFNQAKAILEYRHSLPNQDILTADMIPVSANDFYQYPLDAEQKLLSLIINGSSQTGAFFDSLVDENLKNRRLAPETVQNFMYALAGTLSRALQELKSTPENLYGKTVDWTAIYDRIPDVSVFGELHSIAVGIADAVREKISKNDSHMLSLMEAYIHEHFSRNIQLQDLSEQFNITPKYCSKLFSRLSNDTFKNYLNAFRVQKAREAIEKNPLIKIADLSVETGFNSANSFIRVFGKYTGISPKAYADAVLGKKSDAADEFSNK